MANITYRVNSDPAIPGTSTVKGTPLTNVEVDANFRAIDIEVDQLNSSTVRLTGDQTIGGVKTFSSPIAGAIRQLRFVDNRNVTEPPEQIPTQAVTAEFKAVAAAGNPPVAAEAAAGWAHIINVAGWYGGSGGWPTQISVSGSGLAVRQGVNATTWGSWLEMLHRGNGVALSGDQTIAGVKTFSSPPVVPNDSFSFAQLQNIPTATILGRSSAGTGDVEVLSRSAAVGGGIADLQNLELHAHGNGDRNAEIDFHAAGAPGAADFHARIIRNGGINGSLNITNTGGGGIILTTGSGGLFVNNLPSFACRAWVNFSGVNTAVIRGAGNVSSITDNAVGDYTINFTHAMPDGNYAITGTCNNIPNHPVVGVSLMSHAASFVRVLTGTSGGSASTGFQADTDFVFVAIFR